MAGLDIGTDSDEDSEGDEGDEKPKDMRARAKSFFGKLKAPKLKMPRRGSAKVNATDSEVKLVWLNTRCMGQNAFTLVLKCTRGPHKMILTSTEHAHERV